MPQFASKKSHFFGRRYADDGQGESYDAAHGVGKAQARVENALLRALDAAGGIEPVEACGKLGDILVDAAGS